MKSKEVEALLDVCIKKSLGYDIVAAEKYSIVPCAKNPYLEEGYSFQMLEFELMALGARKRIAERDSK